MTAKRSAGILLFRGRAGDTEVLLGHMGGPFWAARDEGAWSIPKGEYEPDEAPQAAARREFEEELGLPPPDGELVPLGSQTQSGGKVVTVWAVDGDLDPSRVVPGTFEMEWPKGSGRIQEFPEIDRAAWFGLDAARAKLVAKQRPFLDRLDERLREKPARRRAPLGMTRTPDRPPHGREPAGKPARMTKLRLPASIRACLFDLDGVLTSTAVVHAAAWKETFDAFLRGRDGPGFRPFDAAADYDRYVDGLPRADGVRTFLASRDIELPEGTPDDPPDRDTVSGIGNRKNTLVLKKIHERGVEAYPGSVRLVQAVRAAGLRTAVVSSSANCRDVLIAAGIEHLFEVRIDGVIAAERGLPGKPRPDTFLEAARELDVAPAAAAVFEDALAGMEAGRAGHFGHVVGVDRAGQADALRDHGADTVVKDLAELLEDSA